MPNLQSSVNKQDVFAPWENSKNNAGRISIYRYPKNTIKWISLSRQYLNELGFENFASGEYIFLKIRLAKIHVSGKKKETDVEVIKKDYDVVYGPYWFDSEDFTDINIKNFVRQGNEEFHVFIISKIDYEQKLRENSLISSVSSLFVNYINLNAILCKDDHGEFYMFYYIDFIPLLNHQISIDATRLPSEGHSNYKIANKKIKSSKFNLLNFGVNNLVDGSGNPTPPLPGSTSTPLTTACGWRVPRGNT